MRYLLLMNLVQRKISSRSIPIQNAVLFRFNLPKHEIANARRNPAGRNRWRHSRAAGRVFYWCWKVEGSDDEFPLSTNDALITSLSPQHLRDEKRRNPISSYPGNVVYCQANFEWLVKISVWSPIVFFSQSWSGIRMWFLWILSWISLAVQVCFATLSIGNDSWPVVVKSGFAKLNIIPID